MHGQICIGVASYLDISREHENSKNNQTNQARLEQFVYDRNK